MRLAFSFLKISATCCHRKSNFSRKVVSDRVENKQYSTASRKNEKLSDLCKQCFGKVLPFVFCLKNKFIFFPGISQNWAGLL